MSRAFAPSTITSALPRVVSAAKYLDPLPKHRRGTALPCFPLIDDGLPRGTHPGREPRLTQAQTPAHGPDADVVVDRHRRPGERRTTIGWANRPPIVRPPKRPGRGGRKVRLMGRGPVSVGRVSQVISGHAACAPVPRSHVRWLGEPPPRRSDRVSPGGASGPPGAPGPSAASPDRCPTPLTRRARPATRTARLDAGRRHRHA